MDNLDARVTLTLLVLAGLTSTADAQSNRSSQYHQKPPSAALDPLGNMTDTLRRLMSAPIHERVRKDRSAPAPDRQYDGSTLYTGMHEARECD